MNMWNIINSIHSIRTYHNTTVSLFSTCWLLIHHSFIFIGYLWSPSIPICSGAKRTTTSLAGITSAGLITCSVISFPVAAFISSKNNCTLCPSFNLKAFKRELLYEIWPYRGSFSICHSVYNPIYSSSNSSCVKLHLYNTVSQYGSFGPQFFSMKSIICSQCLTSGYEGWSCLLDVWSLLLFDTQRITTMKVVFGNSGRVLITFLPAHSPKSVASCLLPYLPYFLAFQTSLAKLFNIIWTLCRQIHLALSRFSKGSQVSKVSEKSQTAISQGRGPSRNCFNRCCPRIIDPFFFSKNPAILTFFHFLKALKLCCPIVLVHCFKENSSCFKLIADLPSAPPKSNESSLS